MAHSGMCGTWSSRNCILKYESQAFSKWLIHLENWLAPQQREKIRIKNQKKHLNASLQSLHDKKKKFFTLSHEKPKKGSRAGANCDDSGSLNQKIAVSAPFSR